MLEPSRGGKQLKRSISVFFLMMALLAGACKQEPKQPEKISRMTTLNSKADGERVEFVGWVNSVEGDQEVGVEIFMSESPSGYPKAFVGLKDGQSPPEKDRQACVSAQLVRRLDTGNGAMIFYFQEAEVIDCY
jgi:hypothetical protein